jgi:hypothetical protein
VHRIVPTAQRWPRAGHRSCGIGQESPSLAQRANNGGSLCVAA